MRPPTKIATCCYCGNRTVLKLGGRVQHALRCGACGAPVTRMKALKAQPSERGPAPKRPAPAPAPEWVRRRKCRPRPEKRSRRRKSRGLWYHIRELADEIEDFFD